MKFAVSVPLVEDAEATGVFVDTVTDRLMDLMDGDEVSDGVIGKPVELGQAAEGARGW